jgi:hypothetical protein
MPKTQLTETDNGYSPLPKTAQSERDRIGQDVFDDDDCGDSPTIGSRG